MFVVILRRFMTTYIAQSGAAGQSSVSHTDEGRSKRTAATAAACGGRRRGAVLSSVAGRRPCIPITRNA